MNGARNEYFEQVVSLVDEWFREQDIAREDKLKERILSISFDRVVELENRIVELESLLTIERNHKTSEQGF